MQVDFGLHISVTWAALRLIEITENKLSLSLSLSQSLSLSLSLRLRLRLPTCLSVEFLCQLGRVKKTIFLVLDGSKSWSWRQWTEKDGSSRTKKRNIPRSGQLRKLILQPAPYSRMWCDTVQFLTSLQFHLPSTSWVLLVLWCVCLLLSFPVLYKNFVQLTVGKTKDSELECCAIQMMRKKFTNSLFWGASNSWSSGTDYILKC